MTCPLCGRHVTVFPPPPPRLVLNNDTSAAASASSILATASVASASSTPAEALAESTTDLHLAPQPPPRPSRPQLPSAAPPCRPWPGAQPRRPHPCTRPRADGTVGPAARAAAPPLHGFMDRRFLTCHLTMLFFALFRAQSFGLALAELRLFQLRASARQRTSSSSHKPAFALGSWPSRTASNGARGTCGAARRTIDPASSCRP
jgi:hypothetical protein